MEYSQMILAVEAAVHEETRARHAFTHADVAARVLSAHPDIDRKRLERCVKKILTRLTAPYFHGVTADEQEAAFDQMMAGIPGDTPAVEAIAIIQRHLNEWEQQIERAQERMYLDNLPVRAVEPEFTGVVTFGEAVRKVGVQPFVERIRALLLADGYQEYQFDVLLESYRRFAEKMSEE